MSEPAQELEPRARTAAALSQHDWGSMPWKGEFLARLALTPNVAAAARAAGRSRAWVYVAYHEDSVFRDAWHEALDVSVDALEELAHQRASVGVPKKLTRTRTKTEVTPEGVRRVVEEETTVEETREISNSLMIFLLKSHRPDRYRERYEHRVTGEGGGPVQLEVYRKPTRERMLGLARLAIQHELPVIEGESRHLNGNGNHEEGSDEPADGER